MLKFDVLVLGGGLSGLTLALQLKRADAALSVLVLEKRAHDAPIAAHKVGESMAELGSHYLRETLGLKAYLTEEHLPKLGFRFFFGEERRENFARCVEVGSRMSHPIPAHQIDRGLFENELVNRLTACGVEVVLGANVREVQVSAGGHEISYEKEGKAFRCKGGWIIDATGRRALLKRKLGLERPIDHQINAVWFRVADNIDIDDWSDNEVWRTYVAPGRRRLATNHLMGKGYWVWLIPLVSGHTSIGIVADPSFHPLDHFNTFEKAMQWLERNEPVAAGVLGKYRGAILDFKAVKNFSHDTEKFYSTDRWGLAGDAGAFLDPFYSPGTDFIALNNTWLTELITRDNRGEKIALPAMIFERVHRELLTGWIQLYKNMYGLFGKPQIMLMKIVWDWGTYWAIPTLLFMNGGYTNISLLKRYAAGIGQRFSALNQRMQTLFLAWNPYESVSHAARQINVFDLDFLYQFHLGLAEKHDPESLLNKVEANLQTLEQISAEIFRLISAQVYGTPPNMKVDPYTMALADGREQLLKKSQGPGTLDVVESIKIDLAKLWLTSIKTVSNEYA